MKVFNTQAVAREFRAFKSIALTAGLKGKAAVQWADKATKAATGVSPLGGIEVVNPDTPPPVQGHLTVKDLCARLGGISPFQVNKALEAAGLQARILKWGHPYWALTETGKQHSVLPNGCVSPIKSIKWLESVLEVLAATGEWKEVYGIK